MQAWRAAQPTDCCSFVPRTQPQVIVQAGRLSHAPVSMSACCSSPSAALRPARQARAISRRVTATAAAAQQPATGRPAASHRRVPPAAAAGEHAAGSTAASRRAALAAVVAGIAAVGAQPAAADENAPRQGEVRRGRARQANVQACVPSSGSSGSEQCLPCTPFASSAFDQQLRAHTPVLAGAAH